MPKQVCMIYLEVT